MCMITSSRALSRSVLAFHWHRLTLEFGVNPPRGCYLGWAALGQCVGHACLVSNYSTTHSCPRLPSTTTPHYGRLRTFGGWRHPRRRAPLGDNRKAERRHRNPRRFQGHHPTYTCEGSIRVSYWYPNSRQGKVPCSLPILASSHR